MHDGIACKCQPQLCVFTVVNHADMSTACLTVMSRWLHNLYTLQGSASSILLSLQAHDLETLCHAAAACNSYTTMWKSITQRACANSRADRQSADSVAASQHLEPT
jgi:hypothetical protein